MKSVSIALHIIFFRLQCTRVLHEILTNNSKERTKLISLRSVVVEDLCPMRNRNDSLRNVSSCQGPVTKVWGEMSNSLLVKRFLKLPMIN